MTTHTITLARHTAQVVGLMGVLVLGTWDSYGTEQLLLRHGPEWEGLAIDATFHNTPSDEGVTVLADTDGLVTVPPEACMRASKYATITFRGMQDGVQRISCNLPYMVLDHAQVPGANSTATPSEIAQALTQMQDLRDGAVDAKKHAEAARDAAAKSAAAAKESETNAGQSATAAKTAQDAAENARQAAEDAAKKAGKEAGGAAASAAAAKKSAEEAAASSESAAGKAEASESSANAANESAKAAQTAQGSAENAAQTAADAAGVAGQAASAAGSAAKASSTSAGEAVQSAEAAETAKQRAEDAAKKALEAKTGSENALQDADAAKDAASGYANAAAKSATAASASEKNAAKSANSAADSVAAAKKSADDADNTANSIKDSMAQISENKEAVSKLKKDTAALQKRQNVLVGSETGNPVSCNDAFAAPLCGLTVYGKSTQDGTPTPDAPVPIVSAGDGGTVTVKVTGVNLLDLNEIFDLVLGASQSTVKDGHITGTTKSIYAEIGFILKGELSAQYTVSVSGGAAGVSTELRVYIWDNNSLANNVMSKTVPAGEKASCTFKTDGKHEYAVWFRPNAVSDYDFYDIQLELGTTATAYSPYREQLLTLPTPNGLPGIPVTSGGNYTDQNGQQWICDEVDLERGVKVQRVTTIVFSDRKKFTLRTTSTSTKFRFSAAADGLKTANLTTADSSAFCSALALGKQGSTWTIPNTFTIDADVRLYVSFENINSLDELQQYLQQTPMSLTAILATPIETPLSPAEIAAYKALISYAPETVVQASDGAGVKLDYQRDVNLVVKNLEDAIASMTTTT